jgi:hypothetical protein
VGIIQSEMSTPILCLYPLAKLPTLASGQERLTADDRTLLQCAYIWVQTYGTCGPSPPSATASYSELWFMLQYLEQLQILCVNLCHMMPDYVEHHRIRYEANVGTLPYSFAAILHGNFKHIKAAVGNLAMLQFNESCD